jgi:hypothetical protein
MFHPRGEVATKRFLMNSFGKWVESRKLENYFVPSDEGRNAGLKMVTSARKEELEKQEMKSALYTLHIYRAVEMERDKWLRRGERDRCGDVGRV